MTVRVVVADDQPLVREGFRAILDHAPDIVVVGEAGDGVAAVAEVRAHRPDVALLDVRMPRGDGIAATREIVADPALARTRVIVVTTYDLDENVFGALRAGAAAFLLKDIDPDQLRHAVRVVAAGDALLAPQVTRRLIERFAALPQTASTRHGALAGLTDREREIVALVGRGLSNDRIAERLFISTATAKTHVARAMAKTGAHDRAALVVLAYETGLVVPGGTVG